MRCVEDEVVPVNGTLLNKYTGNSFVTLGKGQFMVMVKI